MTRPRSPFMVRLALLGSISLIAGCGDGTGGGTRGGAVADWPAYGRDPGGSRYSPLAQITRENVGELEIA